MKMQGQRLLKEISKEQLDQLTKEVEETMALECDCNQEKIFSVADLWNIQRRKRTIYQRRNFV